MAIQWSGLASAAGTLTSASVSLSDPRPSVSGVSYDFVGSGVDTSTVIRCVQVVIATTTSGTTAPPGFSGTSASINAAASTLVNSSASGWSLATTDGASSSGQKNILSYTNTTGITPTTASGATFIIDGLVSSSQADLTFYERLTTYSATNCTTGQVDTATLPFINTNASTLSLTVDPSLSFSVAGMSAGAGCDGTTATASSTATTIGFGSVTSAANQISCQDLTASTNATNGYSLYIAYTGAPDDGTGDTIADVSGSNASPSAFPAAGTEAYGYSTDDSSLQASLANRFTSPSQGWAAATTSPAEIGYVSAPGAAQHYHIGHQVGISTTTPNGLYTTTIIYSCVPVY